MQMRMTVFSIVTFCFNPYNTYAAFVFENEFARLHTEIVRKSLQIHYLCQSLDFDFLIFRTDINY